MPLLSSAPTSDNHTITPPGLRPGGDPAREPTGLTKRKTDAAAAAGNDSSVNCNYKCWPIARRAKPTSGKHTHAKRAPCRRRKKRAGPRDLPAPAVPRRMAGSLLPCPHDGHLVTTSRCPRNTRRRPAQQGRRRATGRFASGGRARPGPRRPHLPATGKRGLVGLGRLERPTSRLSGVRSNQLSYRPERHPAGPGTRAARAGRCPNLVTAGPHGPTVVCEGTCRRRRAIFTPARSIKTDPWTSPACRVRAPGGGVPVKSSSALDDSKCRRRRLHGVPLERR